MGILEANKRKFGLPFRLHKQKFESEYISTNSASNSSMDNKSHDLSMLEYVSFNMSSYFQMIGITYL